jgi:hypothetical protein
MPPPFDLIVKVLPRDDPLRRSYLQRRQVFVRRSSRIWGYSNRLGAASRLEFLLVPLAYGIGGPVGIVVSANLGAHKVERAVRASWVGVLMACGLTEAIGLAAAAYRRS